MAFLFFLVARLAALAALRLHFAGFFACSQGSLWCPSSSVIGGLAMSVREDERTRGLLTYRRCRRGRRHRRRRLRKGGLAVSVRENGRTMGLSTYHRRRRGHRHRRRRL